MNKKQQALKIEAEALADKFVEMSRVMRAFDQFESEALVRMERLGFNRKKVWDAFQKRVEEIDPDLYAWVSAQMPE